MRTRLRHDCLRAAIVAAVLFVASAPHHALAETESAAPAAAAPSHLVVTDVEFTPTNSLERWLGGGIEGEVTAMVVNTGAARIEGSPGVVHADGRRALLAPLSVDPGQRARVTTTITLGGASPFERDIVVVVGDSTVATTHRTIPWLLVALIGVAINAVLLTGRNQLRAAVRRRLDAEATAAAAPARP